MNHFILRSSVALACVFGLASCGGDDRGEIPVPVLVSGVNKAGMTMKLNDFPEQEVTASGVQYFKNLLPVDSSYNITIKGRPGNVAQDCVLAHGSGKISTTSPQDITLTCVISTFELGGKITGLTSSGLVLINGSDQTAISPTSADRSNILNFTMSGKVAAELPYGVLIYKQPANDNCALVGSTGNGTMPAGAVTSIEIRCTAK
jgi:hypothetical protein